MKLKTKINLSIFLYIIFYGSAQILALITYGWEMWLIIILITGSNICALYFEKYKKELEDKKNNSYNI